MEGFPHLWGHTLMGLYTPMGWHTYGVLYTYGAAHLWGFAHLWGEHTYGVCTLMGFGTDGGHQYGVAWRGFAHLWGGKLMGFQTYGVANVG